MVAISAIEDMKTFYSYTQPKVKGHKPTTLKNGTFKVRLSEVVIKNVANEINNFYAPDLKFLLLPVAWDESGKHVQCHFHKNLDTLAGLGNIVLGSNNTRKLTDRNYVIFSSDKMRGHLGVILAGIVFEKQVQLNRQLMSNLRKIVRKSRLNELVRLDADGASIDESIEELFDQLSHKIEGILNIYCLATYNSHEITQSCDPPYPILLTNDHIHIVMQGEVVK